MKDQISSLLFLKNKLEFLTNEIEGIMYRYEFRESSQSHVIEITPREIYENNKVYRDLELKIEQEFENNFPQEEILFVTEGSLIKISNTNISFSGKSIIQDTVNEVDVIDNYECFEYLSKFYSCFEYEVEKTEKACSKEDNHNTYALAA
jgi:hypothetical protein